MYSITTMSIRFRRGGNGRVITRASIANKFASGATRIYVAHAIARKREDAWGQECFHSGPPFLG